ncbi:copper amine oxidase-like protein [Tumebacillus sp. BK434]|uniref:copper amine oxidase N-terminal domain-containing protein n=1 Tax=Tumebacillus sp. BK434 TaxID=2512169 RepID=UPI00105169CF|nr:copper amine oxidase-like protein [Tumebacillus sp. BK434]
MFITKYKQLFAGILIGSVIAGVSVASADQSITAYLSPIKFTFDGEAKKLPEGYAVLTYKDRTYVPARFVAEELGANVEWINATQTVAIRTGLPTPPSQACGTPTIKGNISSSGEKIYHVPGGQYYEATKAEEMFCTKEEAVAAGYRASLR